MAGRRKTKVDVQNTEAELEKQQVAEDVAEGGAIGAVGGAIVGALAGGPIGAVVGAVIGGAASAAGVAVVENTEADTEETDPGFRLGTGQPRPDLSPIPSEVTAAEAYETQILETRAPADTREYAASDEAGHKIATPVASEELALTPVVSEELADTQVASEDLTPTPVASEDLTPPYPVDDFQAEAPPRVYDERAIRAHAYYLYVERGRGDGLALQDWVQAERDYWARAI